MRRMVSSIGAAIGGLGILVAAACSANSADYTFTQIDVPGANFTEARGINDAGQIVGVFGDGTVGRLLPVRCRGQRRFWRRRITHRLFVGDEVVGHLRRLGGESRLRAWRRCLRGGPRRRLRGGRRGCRLRG